MGWRILIRFIKQIIQIRKKSQGSVLIMEQLWIKSLRNTRKVLVLYGGICVDKIKYLMVSLGFTVYDIQEDMKRVLMVRNISEMICKDMVII